MEERGGKSAGLGVDGEKKGTSRGKGAAGARRSAFDYADQDPTSVVLLGGRVLGKKGRGAAVRTATKAGSLVPAPWARGNWLVGSGWLFVGGVGAHRWAKDIF